MKRPIRIKRPRWTRAAGHWLSPLRGYFVVDLVQDRVRSRYLTLCVCAIVFTLLLVFMLPGILKDPSYLIGGRTAADVTSISVSGVNAFSHTIRASNLSADLTARAQNSRDFGVSRITIRARAVAQGTDSRFAFNPRSLAGRIRTPNGEAEFSSLSMWRYCAWELNGTLPYFAVEHICNLYLVNDTAITDIDGFARFFSILYLTLSLGDLAVYAGIPDEHIVEILGPSNRYNPFTSVTLSVSSNVSSVVVLNDPPVMSNGSFATQPVLQLSNKFGEPVENAYCFAVGYSPTHRHSDVIEVAASVGFKDPLIGIENALSLPSDDTGIVTFTDLQVVWAKTKYVYIDFLCEGVSAGWRRNANMPLILTSDTFVLEVPNNLTQPALVVPDRGFRHGIQCLQISVLSSDSGLAVEGVAVLAGIVSYPFAPAFPQHRCPYSDARDCASIKYPLSFSDANGVAAFCDLEFDNLGYAGLHEVEFMNAFAAPVTVIFNLSSPVETAELLPTQETLDEQTFLLGVPFDSYQIATIVPFLYSDFSGDPSARPAVVELDWSQHDLAEICDVTVEGSTARYSSSSTAEFSSLAFYMTDSREICQQNASDIVNGYRLRLKYSVDHIVRYSSIRVYYDVLYSSNIISVSNATLTDLIPNDLFEGYPFMDVLRIRFFTAAGVPINATGLTVVFDSTSGFLFSFNATNFPGMYDIYEGIDLVDPVIVVDSEYFADSVISVRFKAYWADYVTPSDGSEDTEGVFYSKEFWFRIHPVARVASYNETTIFSTLEDASMTVNYTQLSDEVLSDDDCKIVCVSYPDYLKHMSYGSYELSMEDLWVQSCSLDTNSFVVTFHPNSSVPGRYMFVPSVGKAIGEPFLVTIPQLVDSITVTSWGNPSVVDIGETFDDQPVVLVKDVSSNVVEGVRVIADVYASQVSASQDIFDYKLSGVFSSPSDINGVATFDSLAFSSGQSGPVKLRFVSGSGETAVYSDPASSFNWELDNTLVVSLWSAPSVAASPLVPLASSISAKCISWDSSRIPPSSTTVFSTLSFPVTVYTVDATVSGEEARLLHSTAYTNSGGYADFSDLAFSLSFTSSASGQYILSLAIAGQPSAGNFPVTLTVQAAAITFYERPTLADNQLQVGDLYYFGVEARIASGAPLANELITALFFINPGLVSFDETFPMVMTDSNGRGRVPIRLLTGNPGPFDLRFMTGSLVSSGIVGNLTNPVANVSIISFSRNQRVRLFDDLDAFVVNITDVNGLPMQAASIVVSVQYAVAPLINPAVSRTSGSILTDENGQASLVYRFTSGSSGSVRFLVQCMGVGSELSEIVRVTNQFEPVPWDNNRYQFIVYISIVLILPLLLANVVNESKPPSNFSIALRIVIRDFMLIVMATICSVCFFVALGVLSWNIDTGWYAYAFRAVGYVHFIFITVWFIGIGIFLFVKVYQLQKVKNFAVNEQNRNFTTTHNTHRMRKIIRYRDSLRKMFETMFRDHNIAVELEKQPKDDIFQMRLTPLLKELLRLKHMSIWQRLSYHCKRAAGKIYDYVKAYVLLVIDWVLIICQVRGRAKYIYFPQRFLVGIMYGVLACVYLTIGWFVLSLWAEFGIDLFYSHFVAAQKTVEVTLQMYEQGQDLADQVAAVQHYSSVASDLASAQGVSGLDALTSSSQTQMQIPPIVLTALRIFVNIRREDFEELKLAVRIACIVAAVLTLIICNLVFLDMLVFFRKRILELRKEGETPGHIISDRNVLRLIAAGEGRDVQQEFAKEIEEDEAKKNNLQNPHSHPISAVAGYIGMALGHAVVGYVVISAIIFVITFMIAYRLVRNYLYNQLIYIIITLLTGSFIARQFAKFVGKYYLTNKDGDILHTRLWTYYDFAFAFIGLLNGVVSAIVRFGMYTVQMAINIVRLDRGDLALDAGFRSYQAMVSMHERYDSRIAAFFLDYMSGKLCQIRRNNKQIKSILLITPADNETMNDASTSNLVTQLHTPGLTPIGGANKSSDTFSVASPRCHSYKINTRKKTRNRMWLALVLTANPSLCKYRKATKYREMRVRRRRTVFRWWLAVNLAQNPWLVAMRKKEKEDEESKAEELNRRRMRVMRALYLVPMKTS